jgi:tyrosine-protein phosphatase SIW14
VRVRGNLWFSSPAILTLSFGLIDSATVQARERTLIASPIAAPSIGIGNFGQIGNGYFRGEQPVGADYAELAAHGIKTVIDLQADGDNADEQSLVERAGMAFHRIPMTTHVAPTTAQISQFLQIVTDPANQPVYVHCAGGRHRTGVMTAVYRMEHDGWTGVRAFKEMKQYKFGADVLHPEFKRFVLGYRPTTLLAQSAQQIAATH